jgi:hypothetical protein
LGGDRSFAGRGVVGKITVNDEDDISDDGHVHHMVDDDDDLEESASAIKVEEVRVANDPSLASVVISGDLKRKSGYSWQRLQETVLLESQAQGIGVVSTEVGESDDVHNSKSFSMLISAVLCK